MRLYSRPCDENPSVRVWYVSCYFWDGRKRVRRRRSTGVIDDGSAKQKRTAEAAARDIASSIALGENRTANKKTLTSIFDALIAEMESEQRAAGTVQIATKAAQRMAAYFGSGKHAQDVGRDELRAFADHQRDEHGHSPSTIARSILTFRHAMRLAKLPVPEAPNVGKPRTVERVVPMPATRAVLRGCPRQWHDHVTVYRLLGLRDSELYKIDPDINWDKNLVHIAGTKTPGSDRVVPMPPEVRDILWRRKDRRPMFEEWGNLRRDLRRAGIKAGIGPISPNDLRRSFATELAAKGIPILHVARLMGTSVQMLEKVYARVNQGSHMHHAIASLSPIDPLNDDRLATYVPASELGHGASGHNPQCHGHNSNNIIE